MDNSQNVETSKLQGLCPPIPYESMDDDKDKSKSNTEHDALYWIDVFCGCCEFFHICFECCLD